MVFTKIPCNLSGLPVSNVGGTVLPNGTAFFSATVAPMNKQSLFAICVELGFHLWADELPVFDLLFAIAMLYILVHMLCL